MQLLDINELIPHKKNEYFFDDITGEPWVAFLESIKTSGVIEPIIATQDKVIVSGHQRVKACKKLGIEKVWCDIRTFDSEDEILKQLIETNIRQRGIGNINSVKMMRCERELERIYGVQCGGDRKSNGTGFPLKTQAQLAAESNMSPRQWRNIKNIERLAPEIQDMIEDGKITEKAVRGLYNKLSAEEQRELAKHFADSDKVSSSEIQNYLDELKAAKEENTKLRTALSEQGARNAELQHKLNNREVEIREVEVVPDDYESLRARAKEADDWKANYNRVVREKQTAVSETLALKSQIRSMEDQTAEARTQFKLEEDSEYFAIRVYDFIKKNGGYVWIFEKINDLPADKRQNFVKAISALDAFAKQMMENIGEFVDG